MGGIPRGERSRRSLSLSAPLSGAPRVARGGGQSAPFLGGHWCLPGALWHGRGLFNIQAVTVCCTGLSLEGEGWFPTCMANV